MSRVARISLAVVLLVVLLVAMAAVAIVFLPGTDLIRKSVQDQLRKATGRRVLLGSMNVSPSLSSLIDLTLEGVSVQTMDGEPLFSADRVVFVPSPLSLLRGEVSIKSLTVERFRSSVIRLPGGRVRLPFVPVPAAPVSGDDGAAAGVDGTPPVAGPDGAGGSGGARDVAVGLKWSIANVYFVNGRIDWVDRQARPGREIVIPLSHINGRVSQADAETALSVSLSAQVGADNAGDDRLRLTGAVRLSGDRSGMEKVELGVVSRSLRLSPFAVYLPHVAGTIRKLGPARFKTTLNWEKGRSALVLFEAGLKENAKKGAAIDLDGRMVAAEDFSRVIEVRCDGETDFLPLRFLGEYLPGDFPLDPASGVIKGGIKGRWTEGDHWKAEGSLVLENAVPRGKFRAIGKRLGVWARGKLQPDELLIDNLQVSDSTRLASISGKISKPFSGNPALDLNGKISLNPRWTKVLGIRLPRTVRIDGSIPLRGRVRGKSDNLWFDIGGDLTKTAIRWAPYLEKPAGRKGTLSVKGTFRRGRGKAIGSSRFFATVRTDLAGADIRLTSGSGRLPRSFVHFAGKISVKGKKIDLKDADLAVRRGLEGREIIAAHANISDLGSSDPRITGDTVLNFDKTFLDINGVDSATDIRVKGNAPLTAKFRGAPSLLTWSLDAPATPLDISVGDVFRKPGGIAGRIKASGKWAGNELIVKTATLTLPGIAVAARGVLLDRNGKFQGLTLDLKTADLAKPARYFPGFRDKGLSGPVEATIRLMPDGKGVRPVGTIRPAAVNYRPQGAALGLEKVKGILDLKGDSLVIPQLSGAMTGSVLGPFRVEGSLKKIASLEKLNGRVSLSVRKGRIKADLLQNILGPARLLVGILVDPEIATKGRRLLDFDYLEGDFRLESGVARSDNLRLKGPEIRAGAIGTFQLPTQHLDALVIVHSVVTAAAAIAKIPAVKKFVNKHRGLFKTLGLDKKLKRLGIKLPSANPDKPGEPASTSTPVTVMVRLRGSAANPRVTPVLEAALDKKTASRLKALIH